MTTNAWVDWTQLPTDIGRKILNTATWEEVGGYSYAMRYYPAGTIGRERFTDQSQYEVPVGESFNPNADARTPQERVERFDRYMQSAAVAATFAAVTGGMVYNAVDEWRSSKAKDISSCETKIAQKYRVSGHLQGRVAKK